jgi:hypothetical protein
MREIVTVGVRWKAKIQTKPFAQDPAHLVQGELIGGEDRSDPGKSLGQIARRTASALVNLSGPGYLETVVSHIDRDIKSRDCEPSKTAWEATPTRRRLPSQGRHVRADV